jgi:hypothetical protein
MEFYYEIPALDTVYMILRTGDDLVRPGVGLEAATNANWPHGRIDMSDATLSNHYQADIPVDMPVNHWYYAEAYVRANSAAAADPTDERVGLSGLFWWSGDSTTTPVPPISTNPATAMAFVDCWKDGAAEVGVTLSYRLLDPPDGVNQSYNTDIQQTPESDGTGRITVELLRNAVYEIWRENGNPYRVAIGDVPTATLPQILGNA